MRQQKSKIDTIILHYSLHSLGLLNLDSWTTLKIKCNLDLSTLSFLSTSARRKKIPTILFQLFNARIKAIILKYIDVLYENLNTKKFYEGIKDPSTALSTKASDHTFPLNGSHAFAKRKHSNILVLV